MILLFYWLVGKLYAWEELGPPSSMKLLHETRANASCSLQGFVGLNAGEPDRCPALKLHPRAQLRPAAAAIFGVKENVRRSPRRAGRKAGSGPLSGHGHRGRLARQMRKLAPTAGLRP